MGPGRVVCARELRAAWKRDLMAGNALTPDAGGCSEWERVASDLLRMGPPRAWAPASGA